VLILVALLARFLPETVVEQSFAVSELLACLLSLPNAAVVPLLSFSDTDSELILFAVIELLA